MKKCQVVHQVLSLVVVHANNVVDWLEGDSCAVLLISFATIVTHSFKLDLTNLDHQKCPI